MSGTSSDPQKGTDGFDPYRRRREIELMEQKFRERAERSGGGPVSTNEIDRRVADEMKQFFSESAETAARVVPSLEERPGAGMRETTGEIRRKIDDFFSQVKDAGGGEASPNTQELAARRPRWQGFIPPAPGAQPAPSASRASSVVSSVSSSTGDPPRPVLVRTAPPGQQNVPPPSGQHAGRVSVLGLHSSTPRASSVIQQHAAPEPDAQKMDLRTALERLRRHGVVRPEGGGSPASSIGAYPSPAALPPAPAPAPPAALPVAASAPSAAFPSAAPAARPAPARSISQPPVAPAARPSPTPAARVATPAPAPVASVPPVPVYVPQAAPAMPAPPAAASQSPQRTLPPTSPGATLGAARGQAAFVPPRRDPSVRGLPSLRPDVTPAPGTGPVPVVPPRREPTRPVPVMRSDASSSGVPAPQPGPAGTARGTSPAESVRSAPPADSPNRSVARPGLRDEDDDEVLPRPRYVPSAAAAQRAAAVRKARSDPRASASASASTPAIDRRLPPMPQDDEEPAESENRRPESPIRVVKQRSVVDLDTSTASDEPPARRPSAAAQAFAARFNKAGPRVAAEASDDEESPPPPQQQIRPAASSRMAGIPDPGQSFDDIFDELQGLVIDTLRSSVDESFEVARAVEDEMRISQPITGPVALPPAPVPALARSAAPRVGQPPAALERAPARVPESRPSAPPAPRAQRYVQEPPPPAAQPSPSLDRPAEDAEDEVRDDESPAGPYDWGVRKTPRPQGAWLVEGSEKPLESPRRPAAPVHQAPAPAAPPPAAAPAPSASAQPGPSAAGGARGYLVRKLGDEVKKLQPALEALQAKGVIQRSDFEDPEDADPAAGDDMVSIEQYRERRQVDLETELSPVRVVAELRRIRRLTEALLARGLITEADLQRQGEDD